MRVHERELPPYPVQAWLTGRYKQAAIERGRSDLLPLWSGQSASLIHHRNARELFDALVEETEHVLARKGVFVESPLIVKHEAHAGA